MSTQTIAGPRSTQPRFRKPGVVRNVLSNWGSYAVAMGVNFFLSPYVVRHLGNTVYGVWTLILSLTGYLGLLDLGVRGAVTRYIARFHTQADHHKAGNVASSAMIIFSSAFLPDPGGVRCRPAEYPLPVFDGRPYRFTSDRS